VEVLFPAFYAELRRMAHRQLDREPTGHTLDTTGLVHEAYLRLARQANAAQLNEEQVFALAARAMRRVLVDYARQHNAARRGGGARAVTLDDRFDDRVCASPEDAATACAHELIALDVALHRLESLDARMSRVVELRFYGGLTEPRIAELLGVTERTVRRDWVRAREWLYHEVRRELA
jgi:RNA polymerase sigma factor (TIGR02999 family)